jgi:hypothetical protein
MPSPLAGAMPSPLAGAMLLPLAGALLLLAGCTAVPFGAAAPTSEGDLAAASAVRAFAHICSRPEAAEVAQRSRGLGFVPVDRDRLAQAAARGGAAAPDPGMQLMARPATTEGGVAALLAWNDRGPSCELALTGVAPKAVEREFARMVANLERERSLVVRPLPLPPADQTAGRGLPLRSLHLVAAPAQGGALPQVIALRTAGAEAPQAFGAVLSLHVAQVQRGAAPSIPPPSPALGPLKD